jgi:hypothetical protein
LRIRLRDRGGGGVEPVLCTKDRLEAESSGERRTWLVRRSSIPCREQHYHALRIPHYQWEVNLKRRHYTHSIVVATVVPHRADRGVVAVARFHGEAQRLAFIGIPLGRDDECPDAVAIAPGATAADAVLVVGSCVAVVEGGSKNAVATGRVIRDLDCDGDRLIAGYR